MPTALLPGIGASIRSERAARAMARSSDSASIRLTLMSRRGLDLVLGDDRAGVARDDPGRDPEAGQLLDDDLLVPRVDRLVAAGVERDRDVLERRDRRHDVLDAVLGRRRIAGIGDVVGVAGWADRATSVADVAPLRAGANVLRGLALARDRGRDGRSSPRPRRRSGRATARPTRGLPFGAATAVRRGGRSAGRGGRPPPIGGVRRIEAAAVGARASVPLPTAGWSSWRSGMPKPTSNPTMRQPTSKMNAPGAESRSVRVPARHRRRARRRDRRGPGPRRGCRHR